MSPLSDHPRSRGVYGFPDALAAADSGSSPLARGLRGCADGQERPVRIIPARAGFTGKASWRPDRRGDHPRSRGVYAGAAAGAAGPLGSSPLARGLRARPCRRREGGRIIPARAGFTRWRGRSRRCPWDHPRSRGVYFSVQRDSAGVEGSSPLARGLPRRPRQPPQRTGIIPARAGFTAGVVRRWGLSWDHPRSRGVYAMSARTAASGSGSSPLARGLPPDENADGPRCGIIPARAGFTVSMPVCFAVKPDHPRSRGVYEGVGDEQGYGAGSSPLARGLREYMLMMSQSGRIIPARAGFTAGRRAGLRPRGDHPRSRGVYIADLPLEDRLLGSSPLARGLHARPRRRHHHHGIIPARAGFTRTRLAS